MLGIALALIAGWVNSLRGLQMPFKSEQANRALFGLAVGLAAWNPLSGVGAFLGMLIPHGQWHKLTKKTDYLFILAVLLARGALILAPVGQWLAIPITALYGLLALHLGWVIGWGRCNPINVWHWVWGFSVAWAALS